MYKNIIAIFFVLAVLISPAGAQMRSVGTTVSGPRSVGGVPYGYYNGYPNTYNNGAQYVNPYNTMYGGYSPYASAYQGQYNYGGMSAPVYGAPQLIRGNLYGINIGGRSSQFWRAPSGFYYPWVGGYGYSAYPVYVVPPNSTAPSQTRPPISTVIGDLDNYLDTAKANGKINAADYQHLHLRASDLLSKEKSLTYEEGGVLDPDSEADIRKDVEGLSAEVAHRVKS